MICPKCDFSQPDDIYCANCGVNVEKYLRKKRKSRHKIGINLALILIVALFAVKFFYIGNKTEKSQISRKKSATQRLKTKSPADSPKPLLPESQRLRRRGTAPRSSVNEPQPQVKTQSEPMESTLTAQQWFAKGLSLDDDSEAEIESYEKAIELDPKFAPAYYRLGAIYFRQAEYDLAAENFARFTLYASEADKQTYNVELYFSQEDLEVLKEAIQEPAPQEQEQEVAAEPGTTESAEGGEEVSTEASEEVQSIVRFSSTNGHMVVPVLLNGSRNADLLFDTGAGITVLSRELSQRLGLAPTAGKSITLKTVAAEVQAQIATLDSITVGDFSKANFPVAVVDLNLDDNRTFQGILGMDFLGSYAIRIDNQASRIFLTPR